MKSIAEVFAPVPGIDLMGQDPINPPKNADLKVEGSQAQADKWQKLYHKGLMQDGTTPATSDHRTRMHLKSFYPQDGSTTSSP